MNILKDSVKRLKLQISVVLYRDIYSNIVYVFEVWTLNTSVHVLL